MMSPEALLTILVQARSTTLEDANTPFVLQTTNHTRASLLHPMLPEGGYLVDADMHHALQMLVQWGYLAQPEQYQGMGYLLTPAGLNYAARQNGSAWDGTDRRQRDRRAGRQHLIGAEQRNSERRQEERRSA